MVHFNEKSLMTSSDLENDSSKCANYKRKFADKSYAVSDTAYAILAAMAALIA